MWAVASGVFDELRPTKPSVRRPSDRGLPRGEHQVPDQADQDQREGPAAQQGDQVGSATSVRRFREAADAGDTAKATELAQVATRALDKAASKGVIHKNQAANRKSAIAAKAAQLG